MDFRLTDEQLALQETLRRFIAKDYAFERRRSFARSPLGYSAEAWAQYAELGLLGLPFPEEFGGLGGGGVDIMAVMELVGQGLLLEPYLSTVVVCGGLLRDVAAHAIKEALLPQIGAGKLQISRPMRPPGAMSSRTSLRGPSVTATAGGSRAASPSYSMPRRPIIFSSRRAAAAIGPTPRVSPCFWCDVMRRG
jgi:alkylation response protein AidB-like acyl-CoA dehydrogenase